MSSVDAFLPLKGASERVPGKNMRSFAGSPLFHVIIDTLSRAERIGQVYVDTDSNEIAESASAFPEVVIRSRKPDLIGHDVSVNWLLKDFLLDHPHIEHLAQTHCTNPLLTPGTIDAAVDAYFANPASTSLFTVTRVQARLYGPDGAINHNPAELLPTQNLDPIYLENSNLYVFGRSAFFEAEARITACPMMWEMDPYEAVDIDQEHDFKMAEALYEATQVDHA
jgi:N-acylneuraminate cytidylyltransferase